MQKKKITILERKQNYFGFPRVVFFDKKFDSTS